MSRTAEFGILRSLGLGTLAGVLALAACGSTKDENGSGTAGAAPAAGGPGSGAAPSSGGAGPSSGGAAGQIVLPSTGGSTGLHLGTAGRASGTGGGFAECAGEVTSGKLAPLDMYILLDSSGSMLDESASGIQKWEAVKTALVAFLSDPGSAGLSVGIQYFPQRAAGIPDTCTSHSQCGAQGVCFLNVCTDTEDGLIPCLDDSHCVSPSGVRSQCVEWGACGGDPDYPCLGVGLNCVDNLGRCSAVPSICLNSTECAVAAYASPAVPIAELPQASPALIASIQAREPEGATPTGPAIRGAIEQSRAWANAHPGHAVVAVLATDGLPTDCEPVEIPNIANLAAFGLGGTPSIRTFVVGVFGPNDASARTNLDAIAQSGGTDKAFIVDTSQDVTQQFLTALNAIRGSRLGCEFQIPQPSGPDPLDYNRVNVQLTDGGAKTPIFYVGTSATGCDAAGGWHYDTDPKSAAPSRIIMCPSTCEAIQKAADATVEIQLGCETRPR